jgi:hypothetical protein
MPKEGFLIFNLEMKKNTSEMMGVCAYHFIP